MDQEKPALPPEEQKDDPELKQLLNELASEPAAPEPAPDPIPDPKALVPAASVTVAPVDDPAGQQRISEFVKKFGEVSNEILNNYKSDRDQINDTIEYLENIVFNAAGKGVHIEMLVAALRTKAETNASAVKLLDSLAKFLAATKNTSVFVQNNNNTSIQEDLAKILAKAPYLDETKKANDKDR